MKSIYALCLCAGLDGHAADPAAYLASVADALEQTWPQNRTVNIVCHGHSVPAGYFKTPVVDTFNAYPHLWHQALKERFPHAVINVINTSIGGESSDRGAARFIDDVLTHRPDVVTIDYSLNDRRIGLDAARRAWASMISAANEAGALVVLFTPTADLRADWENPKDPLAQHAAQVRELAKEYDVALVDSAKAFQAYVNDGGSLEDLMSQVNHPNRQGHDLVVRELMRWIPIDTSAAKM